MGAARLADEASRHRARGAMHAVCCRPKFNYSTVPARSKSENGFEGQVSRSCCGGEHPQPPAHRTKSSSCCIMALKLLSLKRARTSADILDATSVSCSVTLQVCAMHGTGCRP